MAARVGAPAPAPTARPGITLPNQTLYINNLNDKISKQVLRSELYVLCSQFGGVLDVVALKTGKMRGQAFVVFQQLTAASVALQKLQGFEFYGKPMRTAFCRTKSDVIAKEDGTFVPKQKRKTESHVPAYKQPNKKQMVESQAEAQPEGDQDMQEETNQPINKILFLERLPDEINVEMLQTLFKQFPGLAEVRMVPGKTGIAFVEFESDAQAATARDTLQGFKLTPTNTLRITYAKKN
ncbi:hypothetical protein GUITHDRAFT_159319 [Guillardia theta CCMP2712]|uniref:RRM domain-containing protein n=1 Tax=Guillardia theta (strain CCMP2712) TaxID=905079 RepID=L1JTF9_GUITC|nr:hypothetical protein GUITHDRAFT_159319 [Guillardia theta CCMP2712]EKX51485.1 hypothetical protein GUITHDRAFT_159319 [Guillardia theta CCMP2712]|mmetsp:Transcript_8405/g.28209  ORF Transcript_8405/g.28209 Transcript_8405/m.28209 type:complete len:238 (-) Transcript_8405:84-797(-)|eukprot:XP_005838465.1 hypothetical protein GUITHDRAFT_159319 [Guillardia theta CCMP2712]